MYEAKKKEKNETFRGDELVKWSIYGLRDFERERLKFTYCFKKSKPDTEYSFTTINLVDFSFWTIWNSSILLSVFIYADLGDILLFWGELVMSPMSPLTYCMIRVRKIEGRKKLRFFFLVLGTFFSMKS